MVSSKLAGSVENIDIYEDLLLAGYSNLQGNIWDGGIGILSFETGNLLTHFKRKTGITKARFLPWTLQTQQPMNENSTDDNAEIIKEGLFAASCDNGEIEVFHFKHEIRPGTNTDTNTDSNNAKQETMISPIHKWTAHEEIVSSIIVDRYHSNDNSHLLVSCGWDGAIRLWDMETFESLRTMKDSSYALNHAHSSPVHDLSFTAYHPSMLISGGDDGFVRIWDLRLPSNHGCSIILEHYSPVTCVSWNDFDTTVGTSFFSGTFSGEIHFHDFRFPTTMEERIYSPAGAIHSRRVRSILPVRSFEGGYVLLSGGDDSVLAVTKVTPSRDNKSTVFHPLDRYKILVTFSTFLTLRFLFCVNCVGLVNYTELRFQIFE